MLYSLVMVSIFDKKKYIIVCVNYNNDRIRYLMWYEFGLLND